MLKVEIDGRPVEVPQGATVMDATNKLGVYVPHFCYHRKLSIAANCRMCLVEVEKAPKPLPACATPVTEGMKVWTQSPAAKKAQNGVMEFLLINHPLDCPICDQGGECQLQDLAVGYGPSNSRYTEEKRVVLRKELGPLVAAEEMSRCIQCTRCVRFGQEIAGKMELGLAGRGENAEIVSFVNHMLESELSGNLIDLCPVDQVAGELGLQHVVDEGDDLRVLPPSGEAELHLAGDLLPEAYAARALNAAAHLLRGDQRPELLAQHDALFLGVARVAGAVADREVLQLAFAALVADRAVERVVDQQELHHPVLGLLGGRRIGPHLHAVGDRGGAGGQRLGRFLDLDQAHAAVGGDRELAVIAEVRHVDAELVGRVHHRGALRHLDRPAVDLDFHHQAASAMWFARVVAWRASTRPHLGSTTSLGTRHLLCSMWCTNSARKCLMKLFTGSAAASPSAQIVRPAMLSETSSSSARSSIRPKPFSMRCTTRYSQPVPSRQGVHWPQDSSK